MDVFFAASPVSHARWGAVVPKHRHRVVERNRLKRRLREIGRTEVLPRLRERGCLVDVLVRTRREAYGASFHVLRHELMEVAESLCSVPLSSG
jgi:ribonuclease P protein component